ncbi:uncharacterized protein EMH_0087550 [Eimeria mitis]|uniref:Uncharacterized protein n=1 Tax=Eimeria mitis TaxID=44415 RepID=U6KI76_9EIME|nr:uncharacterized protein EMH_0087550 [Eimeria mitis]CDJ36491.1 hypothetical protein, conserved [Eimeria mitis]
MREHPFARLPILKREGTARGLNVDLRRSVASQYGLRNAVPLLQEAHELLSREVLYPPEMRELAQAVGLLIAHSMHHESRDVSGLKPSHAVQYLGIRFLVLDVVVSAFLVLEQELEPAYWDLFADAVSHSTPPPPNRKSVAGRRDVSTRRVLALSRAIQTLKKGKRPEPRELIQLKRMLFCWKSSPRYFKSKAFDPWRHDDGCDGDEIGD